MTSYVFGKDITRKFYPLEDNEPIQLVSQAPSIYLFEDQPTLEDARSGIGAIMSAITFWTDDSTSPYPKTYTIPAIADPTPESSGSRCLGYWEAVNYIVQVGGQVQTKLRQFEVEKLKATETAPGTTYTDLSKIYPAITGYVASNATLTSHIQTAEDQIKLELRGYDIDWGDVEDLKSFKYAVAFLAIQFFSESQIVEADDKFAIRAEIYSKRYEAVMSKLKFKYDSDGDGLAESVKDAGGPIIGYK